MSRIENNYINRDVSDLRPRQAGDDELPAWIFDVDEGDNYDENSSLLQELEIDLNLIYG